jgi:hypothetical protein
MEDAFLQSQRKSLEGDEDFGNRMGVTDPVSGETVAERTA